MFDIAQYLENILKATDAHSITNIFLFLIVAIFFTSIFLAVKGKNKLFTSNTPNLLTSLGILGTFIGIVIGLLDFDSKNIDSSIELLLGGLKTAFITSLAGMATAIIYKLLSSTKLFKENRVSTTSIQQDVEPKDILNAINNQTKYLNALWKGIAGNEDSSLVRQIKLLRSDVNDNHKIQNTSFDKFSKELWLNLRAFSEMLSKSATEQVILALKEVISDFNKNLTEQFGDNFKALDASVKKLVDWQAEYKVQLEQMITQYDQGVTAITSIEKSVSNINQETKEIPLTMMQLKSVLDVNQNQIENLSIHLEAFKDIKEQAVQAFPEIQKHVEKTVEGISLSAQKASEGYQVLIENTEGVQKTFVSSIEKTQEQLKLSVSALIKNQVSEIQKSFTALEDGNEALIQNQISESHKLFKALEDEIEKSVDQTGKAVNKKLEMIDDSMNQEINRVMQEMGQALGRISGQFTTDYEKLTRSMKRITKKAEVA